MVRCEICGKECKTAQGLAGHRQWAHGIAPSSPQLKLEQPNPLITESKLEQRLAALEQRLGFSPDELEQRLGLVARPITKAVAQQAKQLKGTTERVAELARQLGELSRVTEKRLTELHSLLGEAAGFLVEDLCLLLLGIGDHKHDPGTGAVTFTVKSPLADRLNIALKQAKEWGIRAEVAEMFSPIARLAEQFNKPAEGKK